MDEVAGLSTILSELGPAAKMLNLLSPLSLIVLALLLVFSVISWSIMIYKWREFRKQQEHNQRFLAIYAKTHDVQQLRKVAAAKDMGHSSVAGLFLRGMDGIAYRVPTVAAASSDEGQRSVRLPNREDLDRLMDLAVQEESARLESFLPVLATIGSVSPFVGLFGTVLGIINAFAAIGEQASANIRTVAPGMAEALIATAAGLFAAIPAVIFYNYCLTKIRREVQTMESFSIEFLMTMATKLFKVDAKTVGGSA
tara:strand:+ start:134 stop:895 length:762 start_codon:yes stop_codon:yes gene_type:complete